MGKGIPWVDKAKPKPLWLHDKSKTNKKSWQYWNKIWNATPLWADREKIKLIYKEAERLRENGVDVHVDHVVPLTSDIVCGLHWHGNLAIIPRLENHAKSNRWWPDDPNDDRDYEQGELF